jgi:Zn finger protein HypA/HybF involved in hydrogenase expression
MGLFNPFPFHVWQTERIPIGSDAWAGTYRCMACGSKIKVASPDRLAPCPRCHSNSWVGVSGDNAAQDTR